MRYCADTQQRCRYSSTNTGWKVPGGHYVSTSCRSAKKGASPLPIHFLALISINDLYLPGQRIEASPRQRGSMAERLKRQLIGKVFERTFAGSNPAASVESSAISSLVYRLRLDRQMARSFHSWNAAVRLCRPSFVRNDDKLIPNIISLKGA